MVANGGNCPLELIALVLGSLSRSHHVTLEAVRRLRLLLSFLCFDIRTKPGASFLESRDFRALLCNFFFNILRLLLQRLRLRLERRAGRSNIGCFFDLLRLQLIDRVLSLFIVGGKSFLSKISRFELGAEILLLVVPGPESLPAILLLRFCKVSLPSVTNSSRLGQLSLKAVTFALELTSSARVLSKN
jgi:hypothetical protein